MAEITSKERIDVYEIRQDDGGVGILIGGTDAIHMGYDQEDVKRLLRAIFMDIDGDLADAAAPYIVAGE